MSQQCYVQILPLPTITSSGDHHHLLPNAGVMTRSGVHTHDIQAPQVGYCTKHEIMFHIQYGALQCPLEAYDKMFARFEEMERMINVWKGHDDDAGK